MWTTITEFTFVDCRNVWQNGNKTNSTFCYNNGSLTIVFIQTGKLKRWRSWRRNSGRSLAWLSGRRALKFGSGEPLRIRPRWVGVTWLGGMQNSGSWRWARRRLCRLDCRCNQQACWGLLTTVLLLAQVVSYTVAHLLVWWRCKIPIFWHRVFQPTTRFSWRCCEKISLLSICL